MSVSEDGAVRCVHVLQPVQSSFVGPVRCIIFMCFSQFSHLSFWFLLKSAFTYVCNSYLINDSCMGNAYVHCFAPATSILFKEFLIEPTLSV